MCVGLGKVPSRPREGNEKRVKCVVNGSSLWCGKVENLSLIRILSDVLREA